MGWTANSGTASYEVHPYGPISAIESFLQTYGIIYKYAQNGPDGWSLEEKFVCIRIKLNTTLKIITL